MRNSPPRWSPGGRLAVSHVAGWRTLEVGWEDGTWTRHAILFKNVGVAEWTRAVQATWMHDVDKAADRLVDRYGGYSIFQYLSAPIEIVIVDS